MSPERVTPARAVPARRSVSPSPGPSPSPPSPLRLLLRFPQRPPPPRKVLASQASARHFRLRVSARLRSCAVPPPRRLKAVWQRGRVYLSRMLSPLPNAGRPQSKLGGARAALLRPQKWRTSGERGSGREFSSSDPCSFVAGLRASAASRVAAAWYSPGPLHPVGHHAGDHFHCNSPALKFEMEA